MKLSYLHFLYCSLFIILIIPACKSDSKSVQSEDNPTVELNDQDALAVNLNGEKLSQWKDPDSVWALRKKYIDNMRSAYLGKIEDPKSYLAFARAYSEGGRIENAIDILTKGIKKFPEIPDFYTYRGENFLRSRQLTECVDDFWKAGQKMEKSTQSPGLIGMLGEDSVANMSLAYRNYLMMGLGFFCINDLSSADKFFEVCGDFSTNSDLWARSYYWQYACYPRSGRTKDAEDILKNLNDEMQILPISKPYLDALKYYKGSIQESELVDPEFKPSNSEEANPWLIKMYAVGVKNLLTNHKDKAISIFQKITASGYWNTLPALAAEAELFNLSGKKYIAPEKIELNNNQKKK